MGYRVDYDAPGHSITTMAYGADGKSVRSPEIGRKGARSWVSHRASKAAYLAAEHPNLARFPSEMALSCCDNGNKPRALHTTEPKAWHKGFQARCQCHKPME